MLKRLRLAMICAMCILLALTSCNETKKAVVEDVKTDENVEILPEDKFKKMLSSVVALSCEIDGGDFWGSGIALDVGDELLILTCCHVVIDSDRTMVTSYMNEKDEGIEAECIWYSEEYDLALLRCEELSTVYPEVTAAEFGRKVYEGQSVLAVGNHDGGGIAVNSGVVSRRWERVSAIAPYGMKPMDAKLIRTDVQVGEGCSGGALFDSDGEVVGVINTRNAKTRAAWAVPSEVAEALIRSYEKNGKAVRLDMGYTLTQGGSPLTDLPSAEISDTKSGTLADALFKKGDMIYGVEINGALINTETPIQLDAALIGLSEGDAVTFLYISDTEHKTAEVKVEEIHLKNIE